MRQNMRQSHVFPLYWMLLASGIVIAAFILWWHGLFHQLYESDVSRLSSLILLVFLMASCHAAVHLFRLSAYTGSMRNRQDGPQHLPMGDRLQTLASGPGVPPRLSRQLISIAQRFEAADPKEPIQNSMLMQLFDNEVRAPVRLGWLLSDLLIKLGLLGTVIGFILMLGAISDGTGIDISNIEGLLADMGSGMRVALFTTLTGLTCGTLPGFQYFLVERSADALMAALVRLVESGEAGPPAA